MIAGYDDAIRTMEGENRCRLQRYRGRELKKKATEHPCCHLQAADGSPSSNEIKSPVIAQSVAGSAEPGQDRPCACV